MPLFRSTLHHNGMSPGELVEIPDAEVGRWEGEIEAGFLTPVQVPSDRDPDVVPEHYNVIAPEFTVEGDTGGDTVDDAESALPE